MRDGQAHNLNSCDSEEALEEEESERRFWIIREQDADVAAHPEEDPDKNT